MPALNFTPRRDASQRVLLQPVSARLRATPRRGPTSPHRVLDRRLIGVDLFGNRRTVGECITADYIRQSRMRVQTAPLGTEVERRPPLHAIACVRQQAYQPRVRDGAHIVGVNGRAKPQFGVVKNIFSKSYEFYSE